MDQTELKEIPQRGLRSSFEERWHNWQSASCQSLLTVGL
jgi:hypothetical protein